MKLSALVAVASITGLAEAKNFKTNPGGPVFKILYEKDSNGDPVYEVRADVKKGE